jgi:hypothetical protein
MSYDAGFEAAQAGAFAYDTAEARWLARLYVHRARPSIHPSSYMSLSEVVLLGQPDCSVTTFLHWHQSSLADMT